MEIKHRTPDEMLAIPMKREQIKRLKKESY